MSVSVNGYGEPIVDEDLDAIEAIFTPTPMPELGGDVDKAIRCGKCHKLLIEFASRPWQVRCGRCKTVNGSGPRRDG